MKNFIVLFFVVVISTFLYGGSDVSDNTGLPNGKPFQTIQNQIDILTGNVSSIEERLEALENAVVGLQSNDRRLLNLIGKNGNAIEDNTVLIEIIQQEIQGLKEAIELKQNIIHGRCSDGQAMIGIMEDGSVACAEVGTTGNLERVISSGYKPMQGTTAAKATATCPQGYILSGGGFYHPIPTFAGVGLYGSRPAGNGGEENQWVVYAYNLNIQEETYIMAFANCLRIQ